MELFGHLNVRILTIKDAFLSLNNDLNCSVVIDCQAKIPAGMFRGKTRFIGSYEQCLQMNVKLDKFKTNYRFLPDNVRGKHCHLRVAAKKVIQDVIKFSPEMGINLTVSDK